MTVSIVRTTGISPCIRHRDGYFFDGQFHLTVSGGSGIKVFPVIGQEPIELDFPIGAIWYLNGTKYFHEIRETSQVRIEVCVPADPRQDLLHLRMPAFVDHPWRFANPFHPAWRRARSQAIEHIKSAVAAGLASNSSIASFPDQFDEDVRKSWVDLGFEDLINEHNSERT